MCWNIKNWLKVIQHQICNNNNGIGSRPPNKASIGKHANSPLENRCFLPK